MASTAIFICYLVDENGRVVLLNRPGLSSEKALGYEEPGCNVLFSAEATQDIHLYQHGIFVA